MHKHIVPTEDEHARNRSRSMFAKPSSPLSPRKDFWRKMAQSTTAEDPLSAFFANNQSPPTSNYPSPRTRRPSKQGGWYDAFDGDTMLRRLLIEDKQFHDLFMQFSESEYSSENLQFFDELQQCKQIPTKQQFRELYKKYIAPTSTSEINLSHAIRSRAESVLSTAPLEPVPLDVLDSLEYAVTITLLDVFARFEQSILYNELKTINL